MAETCGGCGFATQRFAPTKNPASPSKTVLEKIREYQQNRQIRRLETKADTEGLSTREKVDLAALKIDNLLKSGTVPNGCGGEVMYFA